MSGELTAWLRKMTSVLSATLAAGALVAAEAQTKDDFAYWDANGNGDLTCTEARGRDEGLKLPAYTDNRNGTRVIYEWLERRTSSDTDNDGIACESISNPNGYVPGSTTPPPSTTSERECPAGSAMWMGLPVCEEGARVGYDRNAFGSAYSSLEDEIIDGLPKSGGQVYTPYTCKLFDIRADGTAATDIEHIVALGEAIADPTVNRTQKSDRDAGEWEPPQNSGWFANRVVSVKQKYDLSVNPAERDALQAMLNSDPSRTVTCGGGVMETTPTESFSFPDRGGWSATSSGTEETVRVGYGRISADVGSTTPSGIAIFQYRDIQGVLIAEASVPATELIQEGRIFAEVEGPVNTGLAIANPNDVPAIISFYFTDTTGTNLGSGNFELGEHEQTAKFLNQEPFNEALPDGSPVLGTFTFESSVPIAVIALRGFTNEADEFLMTTLPVAPLSPDSEETVYIPHFAAGGGWVTQVILVNPTDSMITGTVGFLGPGSGPTEASPVILTLDDGSTGSDFDYSIPPRSSQRFTTANPFGELNSGSVRAVPDSGNAAPSGLVVFSYAPAGKTLSEAGVPALPKGSAFRAYAEASGMPGQAGSISTGLAITNVGDTSNTVTLEVTHLDGSLAAAPEPLTLPPSGQVARFLNEIFSLPDNFSGVLRVTSTADIAIVALRLRVNENGEIKVTTLAPSNEMDPPTSENRFFAHLADSGGWSTQFILFSGTAGQAASGTLSFIDTEGEPWDLPTTSVSGELPPSGAVADLVVASASVSSNTPMPGQSFDLRATVRNVGTGTSTATTLRYYRSSDTTISNGDTEVGTDAVGALTASGASDQSISLTSPSTPGTYYYGACVDPVSGESNTQNNCSNALALTISAGQPDHPDHAALVALYHATDGPNWVNNENWLTDAPLWRWHGVNGIDRVLRLDLSENNLSGPIPPEIGNLTETTQLTLNNNALSGPIPPEIGSLIRLEGLSLAHNNLDGGPIPLEFANLVSLERLQLDIRHCAPPELRPWLRERRIDILPCTDPGGRLLPTALLREDSGGLSLALDDNLRDPRAVTVTDRAVVTASVQDGWLVVSPQGIGKADVEIVPSGGGATATATVVVRAAIGTFGIDIVMEQPVTEIYAETITAAADWWSSALNGTEWEGRDARQYCEWWEHSVPVAASGNDLVIWATRETDPSYSAGASAGTCRRGEGPAMEPSHYYPVAGHVRTNARVPHFFGRPFIMRHELGHVLGLTNAFPPATGLVTEDRRHFVGSSAVAAFREGGGDPDLPGIPMDGPHWTGAVWPELMIGSDRSGYFADEISVAALADAGYTVDMSKTTPWSSSASAVAAEPVRDVVSGRR